MRSRNIRDQQWYPYAVALCIAVAFYVFLENFRTVLGSVGTFLGYFKAIVLGCVLAYLMNPLAKCFQKRLFKRCKSDKLAWSLSIALTFLTVLLLLTVLLVMVIPQLVESITNFASHFNEYAASLQSLLIQTGLPLEGTPLDPAKISEISIRRGFFSGLF